MRKPRLIGYCVSMALIAVGLGLETTPSIAFFFLGAAALPFAFVKGRGT